MTCQEARPSRKRTLAIIIVLAALLLAAIVLVVLVKATPEAYRRTQALGEDEAAVRQFNERVVNQVGDVLLDKSGGTRLAVAITEAMVNARLARFVGEQDRSGRPVAPVVRNLRLAFEPGRVVVATRVGQGLSGVVVTQHLRCLVEPDGSMRVEAVRLDAGLLPLPGAVMGEAKAVLRQRLDEQAWAATDDKTINLARYALDALDGHAVFIGQGKKRIALDRVTVERGILKVEGHREEGPAAKPPPQDPAPERGAAGKPAG